MSAQPGNDYWLWLLLSSHCKVPPAINDALPDSLSDAELSHTSSSGDSVHSCKYMSASVVGRTSLCTLPKNACAAAALYGCIHAILILIAVLLGQVYATASELVSRGGVGVGALLGAEAVDCALQELYGKPQSSKRASNQGEFSHHRLSMHACGWQPYLMLR